MEREKEVVQSAHYLCSAKENAHLNGKHASFTTPAQGLPHQATTTTADQLIQKGEGARKARKMQPHYIAAQHRPSVSAPGEINAMRGST